MSEPTTTLRFPDRLHTKAKMEATKRGLSLQEFVGQAVEAYLGAKPHAAAAVPPIAAQISRLPARSQKLVERFVDMVELAPNFYLRPIEQYISGMLALFRRVDKRIFGENGAPR